MTHPMTDERSQITKKITENFPHSEFDKVVDLLVLNVNLETATTEELKKIYRLLESGIVN
jgi:hypothetical protein